MFETFFYIGLASMWLTVVFVGLVLGLSRLGNVLRRAAQVVKDNL